MNSVFVNPGIYSCAVDAFLEVCTHLFLPYLSNLPARNEFTNILFNACSDYISLREDSLWRHPRVPRVYVYTYKRSNKKVLKKCVGSMEIFSI